MRTRLLRIALLTAALAVGVTAPTFNGQTILALLLAFSVFLVRPRHRRPALTIVK